MRQTFVIRCVVVLSIAMLGGVLYAQSPDHWAQWRGPSFNGVARGDAPTTWSDTSNIKWKAEIPGRGFSTPVIWGDKIFLTTAIPLQKPTSSHHASQDPPPTQPPPQGQGQGQGQGRGAGRGPQAAPPAEHRFEVICLDRKTGKILWQRTAKVATPHEGYHRMYGSFASNSPATDGKYVYASFGSRGIYAYDLNGKLIWEKDFGVQMKMRNAFGEGVAPLIVGNRLFLVFDHEGESFMVALDKNTGKELWRASRDEPSSWSTPLAIHEGGRTQIVVSATNRVRSYDPASGRVLWEAGGLGSNVIPMPAYQNGTVYVMSGHRDPKLMAIKLGKDGDLTNTDSVLWSHTRGMAYTTSPILHDNILYVVTDNGMISAFNATTGEAHYTQTRFPKGYNLKASPVAANGKLYQAMEDGDVVVVKMGPKFEILATNTLEDQFFVSSPVIAGGEIFLRGQSTLFCISEKK